MGIESLIPGPHPPLDVEDFDRRLRVAVNHALARVPDLTPADLEVHAHPFDVDDLELTPDRWAERRSPTGTVLGRLEWRGFPVVRDLDVEVGRPELRLRWRLPL